MSPMEGEKILMSQGQLQRWHVTGLVEGGGITMTASVILGRSPSKNTMQSIGDVGIQNLNMSCQNPLRPPE